MLRLALSFVPSNPLTQFQRTRATFDYSAHSPRLASSVNRSATIRDIPIGDYVWVDNHVWTVTSHSSEWIPNVVDEDALREALTNGTPKSVALVERERFINDTIKKLKFHGRPPPGPVNSIEIELVFNNNSNSNSNSKKWVSKVDIVLGRWYADVDHVSGFVKGSEVKERLGGDGNMLGLSMYYGKGTNRKDGEPFRAVSEERSDVVV